MDRHSLLKKCLIVILLTVSLLACNLFAGSGASPVAISNTTLPTDQPPEFKDFGVTKVFQGIPAQVNLSSHSDALIYKTQLSQQAAKGPNFAGHFAVVEIGCGSNCQAHLIVDAENGNVYDGIPTQRGININLNSNLYIADPPFPVGTNAYADNPTATLPVRYYAWDGAVLKLIYQESCVITDRQQICGK